MWVEINRYFNGLRKWGDDLIEFKLKNLFEKELVIILDKNYLENYWYMYVIHNPGSLFNQNLKINIKNDFHNNKTKSYFSINYFSSANKPIHPKLTDKQYGIIVTDTIKRFLQNIFYHISIFIRIIYHCISFLDFSFHPSMNAFLKIYYY